MIPHERCRTLEELLARSDLVSLNCPANAETQHLINARTLSLMKSNAVLLNLGRGPLVDEEALTEALESRSIAGACLDVFCFEPASSKTYPRLFALDNVVVTPHIAATTEEITRFVCPF